MVVGGGGEPIRSSRCMPGPRTGVVYPDGATRRLNLDA
jgi:hypothetical protein